MALRVPPLESLRIFEACARHGNFTRAAAELAVTPTAVSQRIRELEARLGVTLFTRQGPRVALSPAGRTLAQEVRPALATLERAISDCRTPHHGLRMTCAPTFANRWLLRRLADYDRRLAADPIHLDISAEERSVQEFDVAIRCGIGPWPGMDGVPLFPLEGTPIMSPDLAARLTGDPGSLVGVPLLPDDRWRSWFRLAGIPDANVSLREVHYPTQDADAVAATNGAGVALLSPTLFADELSAGRLVAPFPQVLRGPEFWWLLTHPGQPQTDFALWLTKEITGCDTAAPSGAVKAHNAPKAT